MREGLGREEYADEQDGAENQVEKGSKSKKENVLGIRKKPKKSETGGGENKIDDGKRETVQGEARGAELAVLVNNLELEELLDDGAAAQSDRNSEIVNYKGDDGGKSRRKTTAQDGGEEAKENEVKAEGESATQARDGLAALASGEVDLVTSGKDF